MLISFLFIFVTSGISGSFMLEKPRLSLRSLHKLRHNHDLHDQDCLCYDKTIPSISDVLSSNGVQGLKRLVVYLYRNPSTKQIHIFSPGKDKQVKFPELGFDSGENIFEVKTEKISDIFGLYHNCVDVKQLHDGVSDHHSYQVDEVGVQTDSPTDVSGEYSVTPKNDDLQKQKESSNEDPEAVIPEELSNINGPHLYDYSDVHNTPELPNSDGQLSPESTEKTPEDTNDAQPTSEQPNPIFNGLPVEPSPQQSDSDDSENLTVQNSESGSKSKSPSPTIPVDDYLSSNDKDFNSNVEDVTTLKGNEHVTFDEWFAQQMLKMQKTGKYPKKDTENSTLKGKIKDMLSNNGLFVTQSGELTDSKANALSVTNLRLRQILIGESVPIKQIFVGNKDKYEFPTNSLYLDAVLLTSVHPRKILGVIPLGKTYVPRLDNYRSSLNLWIRQPIKQGHNRIKQTYQYFQTLATHNHRAGSKVHPRKKFQRISYFKSLDGKTQQKLRSPSDMNYRFDLRKLLETFKSVVGLAGFRDTSNKPSRTASDSQPKIIGGGNNPYAVVIEEESDEEPGFRIIGGIPATSSGTPVSNKGRAGRYYYNNY